MEPFNSFSISIKLALKTKKRLTRLIETVVERQIKAVFVLIEHGTVNGEHNE
jgi:hypothetical protein